MSTSVNAVRLATAGLALGVLSACAASGPAGSGGKPSLAVEAGSGYAGSANPAPALPATSGVFGQPATIAIGHGDLPTEPVLNYISEGKGDPVTRGVRPLVRYVETDWKTGAVMHDSWQAGLTQESFPVGNATFAFASYFNGIRLGSRVEVVNPTGDGDARVFVMDIVGQGEPSAPATP